MELDAPPASTSMARAGAAGASSAAADGVLNDIAVVEAVPVVGAVGPPSPLRHRLALASLLSDPQREPGGPVELSGGSNRRQGRNNFGSRGGGSPDKQRMG
jgi:hypothetical protein